MKLYRYEANRKPGDSNISITVGDRSAGMGQELMMTDEEHATFSEHFVLSPVKKKRTPKEVT